MKKSELSELDKLRKWERLYLNSPYKRIVEALLKELNQVVEGFENTAININMADDKKITEQHIQGLAHMRRLEADITYYVGKLTKEEKGQILEGQELRGDSPVEQFIFGS
jgi:hypothetical protein